MATAYTADILGRSDGQAGGLDADTAVYCSAEAELCLSLQLIPGGLRPHDGLDWIKPRRMRDCFPQNVEYVDGGGAVRRYLQEMDDATTKHLLGVEKKRSELVDFISSARE